MWSYSSNYMGPCGIWWFEENKIPFILKHNSMLSKPYKKYDDWMGGRIDCRCNDTNDEDFCHYGNELPLPIMDGESYNKVSTWLCSYTSKKLERNILGVFEKETGFSIKYFENELK